MSAVVMVLILVGLLITVAVIGVGVAAVIADPARAGRRAGR